MRRRCVVRIVDRAQVRHVAERRPDLAHVRRAAARRREEERRRDAAVPREHAAGGARHGDVRPRRLVGDAAVHLAARVGEEIEVLARLQRRERVRAGGDGLRLERGEAPVVRHLAADDAAHVVVERDRVDDGELAAAAPHDEQPVVRASVPASSGARRAVEDERRAQRALHRDDVIARRCRARCSRRACARRAASAPGPTRYVPALQQVASARVASLTCSAPGQPTAARGCAAREQDADVRDRRGARAACRGSSARGSAASASRAARSRTRPTGSSRRRGPSRCPVDDELRRAGRRRRDRAGSRTAMTPRTARETRAG